MIHVEERISLRDYQEECLSELLQGEGKWNRQCAVMPTGSGKTAVMMSLAKAKLPERTLVLCHRRKLIEQAHRAAWETIGIDAGIEMGKSKAEKDNALVIGSVQSMVNRLDAWGGDHFKTIIVDECHHILSDTFRDVVDHFSGAKVHGFTATPGRGDRQNIATWFDNFTYEIGIRQLIEEKWLAPIVVKALPVKIDMSEVELTSPDFEGQMHRALSPVMRNIAYQIKEQAEDRKTVVYLPLIDTAQEFTKICRSMGLDADWVSGKRHDSDNVLKKFKKAKSGVLCNSMLLTEGWNEPSVDCICNLRPTRSLPLYQQVIGRGTRIHEGKENLLVLDFLYQFETHSLVRPSNLLAPTDEVAERMTERTIESGGEFNLLELEDDTHRDVVEETNRRMEREALAHRNRKARTIDPTLVATWLGDLKTAAYEPEVAWQKEPVTHEQLALLENDTINTSLLRDRGHASAVIELLEPRWKKNLASAKQVNKLKQWGHPNPLGATKAEAGVFIGRKIESFRR